MRIVYCFSLLLAVVTMVGCATTESEDRAEPLTVSTPARTADSRAKTGVGKNVREVIAAADGKQIQFFSETGEALEDLPADAPGSVSIHAADGSGQDNYKFNADGIITRHLRSYGENYAAGIWEPAP